MDHGATINRVLTILYMLYMQVALNGPWDNYQPGPHNPLYALYAGGNECSSHKHPAATLYELSKLCWGLTENFSPSAMMSGFSGCISYHQTGIYLWVKQKAL